VVHHHGFLRARGAAHDLVGIPRSIRSRRARDARRGVYHQRHVGQASRQGSRSVPYRRHARVVTDFFFSFREDAHAAARAWRYHAPSSARFPRGTVDRRTGRITAAQHLQARRRVPSLMSPHLFFSFSILLGASSLSLVTIYPLMKRVTHWPQAVLGTCPCPTQRDASEPHPIPGLT
jgi:hypothetical protein